MQARECARWAVAVWRWLSTFRCRERTPCLMRCSALNTSPALRTQTLRLIDQQAGPGHALEELVLWHLTAP